MEKWRNICRCLIPLTLFESLALDLSVAVSTTINLVVFCEYFNTLELNVFVSKTLSIR